MNESRKKPLRGKQPGQTMDEGRRKPLCGKQPGSLMNVISLFTNE
jgi:hypothetical protein